MEADVTQGMKVILEHSGLAVSTEMMSELRIAAFFSFVLAGAII